MKKALAYARMSLNMDYEALLSRRVSLPKEAIPDLMDQAFMKALLPSVEEREVLVRELEAQYSIEQEVGVAVTEDAKPWLAERRASIDFYYWNRLKTLYLQSGPLEPPVINTLDNVTDEVLDFCGNPAADGDWQRRGMVIGHVQSGKTTNYSALICKAADAGYRIIILLAGLTNDLRRQTQERLDAAFVGRRAAFNKLVATEPLPIALVANDLAREPAYGTTRDKDFNRAQAVQFGVTIATLKVPILFVIKKNPSTLKNLREWLSDQAAQGRINYPALVIDDEADNASVNTEKDPQRATRINEEIRLLLKLFRRSTYIGYTATPFANIFIDPDTEHDMRGHDLFPAHFIKALDPPTNYVGADAIFSEEGCFRAQIVRSLHDYNELLPIGHKASHRVELLPSSLEKAVRVFLLARAVRVLRGQGTRHSSMLVNVSRFNAVQEAVSGLIYKDLQNLIAAVRVNAGLGLQRAARDPQVASLKGAWDEEFGGLPESFVDVLGVLHEAAGSVKVQPVNMRGGSLDYESARDTGLHVIAVGGLALSRGLTLEGLLVSYVVRNAGAADTLMQMARWFGYRHGYEDLCRLYLNPESDEHYMAITESIEELREEIRRMQRGGLTPSDFGLRVRQSPTAIRITAANKMRNSSEMTIAQSFAGRHVEGHSLQNSAAVNEANRILITEWLNSIGQGYKPDRHNGLVWRGVPGKAVLEVIRKFQFPASLTALGPIAGQGTSLFIDYVSDRLQAELATWDVFLPTNEKDGAIFDALGPTLHLRSRRKGDIHPGTGAYRVFGARSRVADPMDARVLIDETELAEAESQKPARDSKGDSRYCAMRKRPLLIVHLFTPGLASVPDPLPLAITGPACTLSACLPNTEVRPQERTYHVNAVYRRMILEESFVDVDEDADAIGDLSGD